MQAGRERSYFVEVWRREGRAWVRTSCRRLVMGTRKGPRRRELVRELGVCIEHLRKDLGPSYGFKVVPMAREGLSELELDAAWCEAVSRRRGEERLVIPELITVGIPLRIELPTLH